MHCEGWIPGLNLTQVHGIMAVKRTDCFPMMFYYCTSKDTLPYMCFRKMFPAFMLLMSQGDLLFFIKKTLR